MIANLGLQGLLFGVVHDLNANFAASAFGTALQNSHDSGFIATAGPSDFLSALLGMHIACFTANESFVCFHLSRQLVSGGHAEREPDAVVHEPCRFLGDANGAVNLVGT